VCKIVWGFLAFPKLLKQSLRISNRSCQILVEDVNLQKLLVIFFLAFPKLLKQSLRISNRSCQILVEDVKFAEATCYFFSCIPQIAETKSENIKQKLSNFGGRCKIRRSYLFCHLAKRHFCVSRPLSFSHRDPPSSFGGRCKICRSYLFCHLGKTPLLCLKISVFLTQRSSTLGETKERDLVGTQQDQNLQSIFHHSDQCRLIDGGGGKNRVEKMGDVCMRRMWANSCDCCWQGQQGVQIHLNLSALLSESSSLLLCFPPLFSRVSLKPF
jgi:hypothetical protein